MQPAPVPPPGPLTWSVGVQTLTAIHDATGKVVQAWNVPFTLSNGVTDSVNVPVDEYTVDNVRAAIAQLAAAHAAVANLTGTANP